LMDRRRRRRRVHVMFRLPLRSRRESLRRRIVLPLRLCRRRTVIIGTPYSFRLSLMVITCAIRIASTVASVPSGLLIHYLWIAVAIDSPAIVVSVRLWLRWRIVSSRHSRHIVIGIDSPASVPTRTVEGMFIAIAVANSAANRTSASSHRSTRHGRWFVMISSRVAIDNPLVCRGNRRTEARRRIHQPRPAIPSAPAARRPAPAASVHENPPAIAIRHPSPRVRRNPRISKAWRIAPIAIAEWVPVVADIVGLPDFAITRGVIILAVIIQVACAILIR
jgi:hypothetical protein